MSQFLKAIAYVTGPLSLVAFLAVIFLAVYQRSVKDQRGLEFLYNLLKDKLSKKDFYRIALLTINRMFQFILIFFFLVFVSWGWTKYLDYRANIGMGESAPSKKTDYLISGTIFDYNGVRVSNAEIEILYNDSSQEVISKQGSFSVSLKGYKNQRIRIRIKKTGFKLWDEYATIPTKKLIINLEKINE